MDMGTPSEGQNQPQGQGGDASQGFEICIQVRPSGITVTQEPLDPAEEQGEPGGQAVQSIGEALKQALAIYKQATVGGDAESQLMSGFQSPDGGPSSQSRPQPGSM